MARPLTYFPRWSLRSFGGGGGVRGGGPPLLLRGTAILRRPPAGGARRRPGARGSSAGGNVALQFRAKRASLSSGDDARSPAGHRRLQWAGVRVEFALGAARATAHAPPQTDARRGRGRGLWRCDWAGGGGPGRQLRPTSALVPLSLRREGYTPPPPPCDIPSGCSFFTGPGTVTRSSLRMLRRVAAFCRPLRPVLLLVLFPRSRSPVVDVPGLCWMWHGVPFARQRRPIVGVLGYGRMGGEGYTPPPPPLPMTK